MSDLNLICENTTQMRRFIFPCLRTTRGPHSVLIFFSFRRNVIFDLRSSEKIITLVHAMLQGNRLNKIVITVRLPVRIEG